jgi:hypothetical protein
LAVVGVWLVLVGHRHAALFAAVLGFNAFLGIAASHLAPDWGFLSDSYTNDVHADALSWAAVLLEMAAAGVLGFVGMHYTRARSSLVPA